MFSCAWNAARADATKCLPRRLASSTSVSLSLRRLSNTTRLNTIGASLQSHFLRPGSAGLSHHSKYLFSDSQAKDDIEAEAEVGEKTDGTNTMQTEASETAADEINAGAPKTATFDEHIDTEVKSHAFQTETKQLLNIVANSLYTDKEVFLRELLSNSSDALEKTRYYLNTQSQSIVDPEKSLEISVFTDADKSRLIIQDTGIGMSHQDLMSNLGTIARSGSKAFVEALQSGEAKTDAIIGQFGVGFYSIFMVCDKVEVYSRPAVSDESSGLTGSQGYYWTSDGSGEYSIAMASNVDRGTKIILHLKPECAEFCQEGRVQDIIKKYSSFLEFDINLNGRKMGSTGAIWAKHPSGGAVSEEQYRDFFQMISDRGEDPYYTFHSHFDTSQFSAQCLVYVPEFSGERFGGRQPSGVSLYCKKVLVSKNCQEIVPEWLRFVKGVVDCENIPIHISRENMQDSLLMEQLRDSVSGKVIDFLNKQAKKDRTKYDRWYKEFEGYIKEGVVSQPETKSKEKICKLLRYQVTPGLKVEGVTESTDENSYVSFDEYIASLPDSVKSKDEIYYLCASNRESALKSPYIESFIDEKIPVLLCYQNVDEWIMKNIDKYKAYKLVGVEGANITDSNKDSDASALTPEQCDKLGDWMKSEFGDKIERCEITQRLKSHPCVLTDHTPQAIRQLMKSMGQGSDLPVPPQTMQINPKHPIVKELFALVDMAENGNEKDALKARVVAKQLINNAFIAAGLIEDAKEVLGDINELMELALGVENIAAAAGQVQQPDVVVNEDVEADIDMTDFGEVEEAEVTEKAKE